MIHSKETHKLFEKRWTMDEKTLVSVTALNTKTRSSRFSGRVLVSNILVIPSSPQPQMHQIFLFFSILYMLPHVLSFYSESHLANIPAYTWYTQVCAQTTYWTVHNHVQIMQNIYQAKEHTSVDGIIIDFFQNTTTWANL